MESKSRAEVLAELAEAKRTGNVIFDENGQRYNEVFPHNYPAQPQVAKTREQVRAELAQAIADGSYQSDIPA